jgi:hypothetical protein
MNQIPTLVFVPPAKEFDLHPRAFQRKPGLLNLSVGATVRQQEGQVLVNQDFHPRNMPAAGGEWQGTNILGAVLIWFRNLNPNQ